jgi:hypothetical protein
VIDLVISGGQTGADYAGLRAAAALRIPTGGWAPKGFMTEDGPRLILGRRYGLKEHPSPKYPPRTAANIRDSALTLILADKLDRGSGLTRDLCFRMKKPVFHFRPEEFGNIQSVKEIIEWIERRNHTVINIAGNRESRSPGMEKSAFKFLIRVFAALLVRDNL